MLALAIALTTVTLTTAALAWLTRDKGQRSIPKSSIRRAIEQDRMVNRDYTLLGRPSVKKTGEEK